MAQPAAVSPVAQKMTHHINARENWAQGGLFLHGVMAVALPILYKRGTSLVTMTTLQLTSLGVGIGGIFYHERQVSNARDELKSDGGRIPDEPPTTLNHQQAKDLVTRYGATEVTDEMEKAVASALPGMVIQVPLCFGIAGLGRIGLGYRSWQRMVAFWPVWSVAFGGVLIHGMVFLNSRHSQYSRTIGSSLPLYVEREMKENQRLSDEVIEVLAGIRSVYPYQLTFRLGQLTTEQLCTLLDRLPRAPRPQWRIEMACSLQKDEISAPAQSTPNSIDLMLYSENWIANRDLIPNLKRERPGLDVWTGSHESTT